MVGCGVGLWAAAYFLFGLIDEKALLARCFNLALATLILLLLVSLELERSALLPLLDRIFRQKALPASRQQPPVADRHVPAGLGGGAGGIGLHRQGDSRVRPHLSGCQSAQALESHERRSAACTRAAA